MLGMPMDLLELTNDLPPDENMEAYNLIKLSAHQQYSNRGNKAYPIVDCFFDKGRFTMVIDLDGEEDNEDFETD
jgi:hypothetical protein